MSANMITKFFPTIGKRKPDHDVHGNNDEDTSERQKTAEPVVLKEQAITASLKTLLKWEKELHTDRFYYGGVNHGQW
jgi:hypothetical protein